MPERGSTSVFAYTGGGKEEQIKEVRPEKDCEKRISYIGRVKPQNLGKSSENLDARKAEKDEVQKVAQESLPISP